MPFQPQQHREKRDTYRRQQAKTIKKGCNNGLVPRRSLHESASTRGSDTQRQSCDAEVQRAYEEQDRVRQRDKQLNNATQNEQ